MTDQRKVILSVIETSTKHLDASQILGKAQKVDASVDRRSVYQRLDLLKRQGLIDELDLMHLNGEGNYCERKLGQDHIHQGLPAMRSFQQVSSHRGRHPRSDLEARGTMYSVVALWACTRIRVQAESGTREGNLELTLPDWSARLRSTPPA